MNKRWWLGLLVLLIAGVSMLVYSQVTTVNTVNLSTTPLYSAGARDKPTLSLALSVEFPTVGAQYLGVIGQSLDASYAATNEYLGYFDAESCYTYNNHVTDTLRRFDRTGAATARTCGGTGFSGNFMNWASSSAIDVLRLGLTGGDRIVDTANLTVLQRAVLPQRVSFWNGGNFPSKQLTATDAAGALPNTLRQNYTGTVYVANCLNRIHFGTSATGSCLAPGANTALGTSKPPVLWSDFLVCAAENGTCTFAGLGQTESRDYEVAYGADGRFNFASRVVTKTLNTFSCSNASLGPDPAPGSPKNCYARLSPSTNPRIQPAATQYGGPVMTADNFFYSRVQVCESNGAGVLQDPRASDLADKQRALCLKYPNDTYKPVGQLQKSSDILRVAAFGYLMDDRQDRYGGVLRAPMKYVGGKTFDSTGNLVNGTNPNVEWDVNTGVFVTNPQLAAEGKSGVINYLNQFGRTGANPGTYKTYDPVGELYYEALRYVQGLGPTAQAVADLTDDRKDGFPVYTSWTDPHAGGSSAQNYSCVRNNILVIGDVNTHNDKSIPGVPSTRSGVPEFSRAINLAGNEPDFHTWTKVLGGFESGTAVSYLDGKGITRTTSNPSPAPLNTARQDMQNENIGATNAAYYIAGMAYWANTHDIRGSGWTNEPTKQRPGMRVSTYTLDVNENGSQNNVDTRRKANQYFFAAKYGGFDDKSDIGNPYLDKSGTLDNSSWQRQGDPGEAKNYFLSSNARAVLSALDNIFLAIAKKGNSIAGSAISSKQLITTSNVYQAQFDPAAWNGDLQAIPLTRDTSGVVTLSTTAQWSAATQLDSKDIATRNIIFGKAVETATDTAVPFLWTSLDTVAQTDLNRVNPTAIADARGQDRLAYLRGDRTLETSTTGSTLRRRASRLGDIINSGVVLSGAPTRALNSAAYLTFYNINKSRVNALFAGANDGMLHAFNVATGNELFAYIPSWMGPKLSALTTDGYLANHQSYVDATPVVAEAEVGATWKTVLVGGTGAGGQGVYALDVTDPAAFTAAKVMWEFTDRNDPAMGNVIGQAQIRRFRVSAPSASTAQYKWFAVVASGVNNYASGMNDTTKITDSNASGTANPHLFLLDLSKPVGTAWSEGVNYYKMAFPIDSTLGARATGLANFDVTLGAQGEVHYLYAGDLHGRMWKLDFFKSALSSANWTVANLSAFVSGTTPLPLFTARDSAGIPQPITGAPYLASGPRNSTIVVFGTGKYLESSDNTVDTTTQVQSLYAIYDDGTTTNDSSPAGSGSISGRGRLRAGSVSTAGAVTVPAFIYGKASSDGDSSKRSGWYFDFSKAGERQIAVGETIGRNLIFGSIVPPSSATQICSTGTGYLYALDVLIGNGSSVTSDVGLLGPPIVLESGSGLYTASDSTGRRTKTVTNQLVLQGSTGLSLAGTVTSTVNLGRLSWRQINNYQELRNTP